MVRVDRRCLNSNFQRLKAYVQFPRRRQVNSRVVEIFPRTSGAVGMPAGTMSERSPEHVFANCFRQFRARLGGWWSVKREVRSVFLSAARRFIRIPQLLWCGNERPGEARVGCASRAGSLESAVHVKCTSKNMQRVHVDAFHTQITQEQRFDGYQENAGTLT